MVLGLQLMLPPAAPPSEPPGLAARRQRPVMVPPVPEYAAILASPIFAPDRRPGAAGTASEGGGSLNGYAAIGVVAGRAFASAVVTLPGGGIKTLRLGDEVEGWRLVGVDRTQVSFERNGLRHVLVVGAPPEASPPQEENAETPGAATPTVNP
jgi:hypothetical protein